MRKINTRSFRLATRSTVHEVNRQIVLNLVRENAPISRAELARRMGVHRSALTGIVRELVDRGIVYERGTAATARGRRPTLLDLRTHERLAAAADVRPGRTTLAVADFAGRVVARDAFDTPRSPEALADVLSERLSRLLGTWAGGAASCEGVGVVVPGMVDRRAGRILYAPRLGWRDVELRETMRDRLPAPVFVESAPIACALARLWLAPEQTRDVKSFAYVSVSDGVGVGIVVNGETLRGDAHTAGEFGHVSLDPNGPECACGKKGCWEAFACNAATLARYADHLGKKPGSKPIPGLTVEEVVRRALRGEAAAIAAVEETGTYIGRGLVTLVSTLNPGRIYVGGEITAAWEILERPIRQALSEGSLTPATRATPVVPDGSPAEYRVLGAVALVAAPTFAAPRIG
ncbi:MAG TPA: ROK family transcriptional regulator [Terriglobales bacterium]|nr:ROK family transcriptional regulator [Terriglobales bacterium]